MNVKLIPAREVKVGMYIEIRGRWLQVSEVVDWERDLTLGTIHGSWMGDPETLVLVSVPDEKEG